ncbi:unnamed protein product [Rangifer tarandus platyrhynchus]|uniref:Uncharacterized protein n=1 Tax=Rangifer tarandus platyrhynchus TaxID=3082113 RepID=A0ACB1KHK4_RANTA
MRSWNQRGCRLSLWPRSLQPRDKPCGHPSGSPGRGTACDHRAGVTADAPAPAGSGLDSQRSASLPASGPADNGLGPRDTLTDRYEFMSKFNIRTQAFWWPVVKTFPSSARGRGFDFWSGA